METLYMLVSLQLGCWYFSQFVKALLEKHHDRREVTSSRVQVLRELQQEEFSFHSHAMLIKVCGGGCFFLSYLYLLLFPKGKQDLAAS